MVFIFLGMPQTRRIFLLPGFGEDVRIFRKLRPYLQGFELVDVEYEAVLNRFHLFNIHIQAFARQLATEYKMDQHDILIGHSFGGYTAHAIRQQLACEACLIASFTDPAKVRRRKGVSRWNNVPLIMLGMLKSAKARSVIEQVYAGRESLEEILSVMDNFRNFRQVNLAKQDLMMWQKPIPLRLEPSLRIHSRADRIVRYPDEPFEEVPGDHFNLVVHHQAVGELVAAWLQRLPVSTQSL
ncbi:MAG: hypothetical protein D6730_21815 [Bacteroidetes bacterium]|nr:MAG: hypothetical protein D6730_21815 [Bacteroidota bacterium]